MTETTVELFTLVDDEGEERSLEAISREDWENTREPCPDCGEQEFVQFATRGGQYGEFGGAIIERTDYGWANRTLLVRCRECGAILFKHPAFDLLFDQEEAADGAVPFTRE